MGEDDLRGVLVDALATCPMAALVDALALLGLHAAGTPRAAAELAAVRALLRPSPRPPADGPARESSGVRQADMDESEESHA